MTPEHLAALFITVYFAAYWLLAWFYAPDKRLGGDYYMKPINVLLDMGFSRILLASVAVLVALLWYGLP